MAGTTLLHAPNPPRAPKEPENVVNTKPSKLVHLGRTPAQKKANNRPMAASDAPAYGYGLELNLDPDQVNSLGLGAPAAGSTVHAMVKMHVTSSRSEPTVGGKARHHVGLTVTHMAVHPGGEGSHGASKVKRAPAAKGAAVPKGHVAVASHVRRVGKPKPAMPAHRSAFVKPPTVKRVR